MLPRPAKGSLCGGFADGALEKLRLLKASLSPPNALWFCPTPVGEGIPALIEPEEMWEEACCCG